MKRPDRKRKYCEKGTGNKPKEDVLEEKKENL
jgi:hypothetical protein